MLIDSLMARRGQDPASKANLKPREARYGERKKRRAMAVTDDGWTGFREKAAELGLSASELVEHIGRGWVALVKPDPEE